MDYNSNHFIVGNSVTRPVQFSLGALPSGAAFTEKQGHGWNPTNVPEYFQVSTSPRALCHSIKTNTDSPVKGMILFDQGGGGRGGGKRSWSKALPPVSPWSACFLLLFARRIFSDISVGSKLLVRNSPARPLLLLNLQVFWGPSQEPPASLAFCFLGDCFWRPLRPAWPPGTLCIRKNPSSMKLRESDFLGILVDWLS